MRNNLLKKRARDLRKNMTMAEKKLWHRLRQQRLGGIQFRRQVILGNYIVDFISFDPKVIKSAVKLRHSCRRYKAQYLLHFLLYTIKLVLPLKR